MSTKRKPRWKYKAVLGVEPFHFTEEQKTAIGGVVRYGLAEHIKNISDDMFTKDWFARFIEVLEDEVAGYKAYLALEQEQPTVAEVRVALDEIDRSTAALLKRLRRLDSHTRKTWAPYLEVLFDNIAGITRSPHFYLDNNFRDNIDVLKRFLKNVQDSLCPVYEATKTEGGRPKKHERLNFIRALADRFEKHLKLPVTVKKEKAFDLLVRVCLNAAGDEVEDHNKWIRRALSET
ncbi:MAG: hypothetical protein E2O38_08390 [Proteobacteria bacterium]|nr:MAG: hypothetical protein E2O38_08390 [Pseudomonadota bacterium]